MREEKANRFSNGSIGLPFKYSWNSFLFLSEFVRNKDITNYEHELFFFFAFSNAFCITFLRK